MERLKAAIEKARAKREALEAQGLQPPSSGSGRASGTASGTGPQQGAPHQKPSSPPPNPAPNPVPASAGPGGVMGGAPGGVGPLARAAEQARAAAGRSAGTRGEIHASTPAPEAWTALEMVEPDDILMTRNRLVSWKKSDPAYVAFDVLRTRMGGLLRDKGWKRVAITSPSKADGKTTLALNLAMSFARQAGVRTMIVDLDLKQPAMARALGFGKVPFPLASWLHSDEAPHEHFIRVGENLAVGLNTSRAPNSAELIQDPATAARLAGTIAALKPDVVIYDLPPLLVSDDTLAFLPQVDCTLMVAGAGQATADQIEECERLLNGQTEFLGVVLNKCETKAAGAYHYYETEEPEPA